MLPEAKGKFFKLLGEVMAGYGKELDPKTMDVWFNMLLPFEPAVIRRAFDAYAAERPDFAPAPNGIAARCRLLDGRPEENEAWALALASRDERDTVIWTEEMRDAFMACRPVLDAGDEIGARMAFKEAYARLVGAARAQNRPAVWLVSEGWDKERKALVVQQAQVSGLLPAPPQHLAIECELPAARPEGLQQVLAAVAQLENPLDKAARIREERLAAEDEAERARKAEIDRQAKAYMHSHPEARYGQLHKVAAARGDQQPERGTP